MYVDIRVFDFVLLGLILFMVGALIAHLGRPEQTNTISKWLSIIGAVLIVVAGTIRLLGLGL